MLTYADGKVFSGMASLLAALLTLTCFAVSFASAGGGALFSGPALLEVSGFTAAPKGEAAVVAPSGGIVQVPVVVAPKPPPNAPRVAGLAAAPKGEEAAGFAVDEGAADVEFAAGFAPATAIWRAKSETDGSDGT
jgi:hypothetical protein